MPNKKSLSSMIQWRIQSESHDWAADDIGARIWKTLAKSGIIEELDACEFGVYDEVTKKLTAKELCKTLEAPRNSPFWITDDGLYFEVHGRGNGFEFFARCNIDAWDAADQSVRRGANSVEVFLDRDWVTTRENMATLMDLTLALGKSKKVAHGYFHPASHKKYLDDKLFQDPITFVNTLTGPHWFTYIGPGEIDEFDQAKLKVLPVATKELRARDFWFTMNMPFEECDSRSREAKSEYIRVRDYLRSCLRPDSNFYAGDED